MLLNAPPFVAVTIFTCRLPRPEPFSLALPPIWGKCEKAFGLLQSVEDFDIIVKLEGLLLSQAFNMGNLG